MGNSLPYNRGLGTVNLGVWWGERKWARGVGWGQFVKDLVGQAKELTLYLQARLKVYKRDVTWLNSCLTLDGELCVYTFDTIEVWFWIENELVRQSLEATWGRYYTVQERVDSNLDQPVWRRTGEEDARFMSDLGAGRARPGCLIRWFLFTSLA